MNNYRSCQRNYYELPPLHAHLILRSTFHTLLLNVSIQSILVRIIVDEFTWKTNESPTYRQNRTEIQQAQMRGSSVMFVTELHCDECSFVGAKKQGTVFNKLFETGGISKLCIFL